MELQLQNPGDYPHVHHVEEAMIAVVHGEASYKLDTSFILGEDQIIDWQVSATQSLSASDVEPILDLEPEVVLLGTGRQQTFPGAEVMASFLQRRIGIEPMDNAAAARTHTILTGEDRRVVAAFMMPEAAVGEMENA